MHRYLPGQRYRNTLRPELGSGMVVEVEPKHLSIYFPLEDEVLTMGIQSAPLRRVELRVGETSRTLSGLEFSVDSTELGSDGLLVFHTSQGPIREDEVEFSKGGEHITDLLTLGQFDSLPAYYMRREVRRARSKQDIEVAGLVGPRVGIYGHQMTIAHQACLEDLPKVLLADEVGLGKTIEAGLIINHLLVQERAKRVLIATPNALIHQWFVEMLRKFHLSFYVLHEQTDKDGDPFDQAPFVLVGHELLRGSEIARELALNSEWDLVVVDEAHKLTRENPDAGEQCMLQLVERSAMRLLLSATPQMHGREAFEKLIELCPQMFRNTRQALEEAGVTFPSRIPHFYTVHGEAWEDRLGWFVSWLEEHRDQKVVLICKTKSMVTKLAQELPFLIGGLDIASFHSDLAIVERDRQAAYFVDPEGANLLLCTEIGSEGRNFQCCQNLVLFDVAEGPEQLEQRIGRLDRIGQTGDVHIHIPTLAGLWEEQWIKWYDRVFDLFRVPLNGGREVFEFAAETLESVKTSGGELSDDFINQCADRYQELQKRNSEIELTNYDESKATKLRERVVDQEQFQPRQFLEFAGSVYGLDVQDLDDHSQYLALGDGGTDIPATIPGDGMSYSFDRTQALQREDLQFMTWEHPMLIELCNGLMAEGAGRLTICTKLKKNRPTLYLEVLANTGERVLIDSQGTDLSEKWDESKIDGLVAPLGPRDIKAFRGIPSQKLVELLDLATRVLRDRAAESDVDSVRIVVCAGKA